MVFLHLYILFLALAGPQSTSNPPVPGTGLPSEKEQPSPTQKEDPGDIPQSPQNRDSDAAPPSQGDSNFILKEKEKNGRNPGHKPANENDYRIQDWLLLFVTGVLAAATIVLVYFTKKLASAARKQNRISKELQTATSLHHQVISRQVLTMNKQYRLNRLVFYTENRPRLRVQEVRVEEIGVIPEPTVKGLDSGYRTVDGYFKVVNAGNTSATVVCHFLTSRYNSDPTNAIEKQWDSASGTTIDSGCTQCFRIIERKRWSPHSASGKVINLAAYAMGGIRYRDELGRTYETRFWWTCKSRTKRFEPVKDSDYNYET